VIVTFDPPKMATRIPPATEAITPEMGGASDASARPSPKGSAISETTNPEKIFLGKVVTKELEFERFTLWIVADYQEFRRQVG
jgi:hypothetical protein